MKLSLRNSDAGNLTALLGSIMLGLILIVVGLSFVPTIQSSANSTVNAVGTGTAGANVANLIPTLFILTILAAIVGLVIIALKSDG